MKKLIAIILMVMSSAAFAVNYGETGHNPGNPTNHGVGGPPVQNGGGNNNGGKPSVGDNTLTNVQGQTQHQTAVGVGIGVSKSESSSGAIASATGGSASAAGGVAQAGASTGPVSVTNNIGGDSGNRKYSGSYTVRSVGVAPDIVANPTAPCRVAVGASGAIVGGSVGFVGSVLDEGCDARADATMLMMMGYEGAAASRLCQKPEMAVALGPVVCPTESKSTPVTSNGGSSSSGSSLFNH